MRRLELDGRRYDIGACGDCPMLRVHRGMAREYDCVHPALRGNPALSIQQFRISTDVDERCPLAECNDKRYVMVDGVEYDVDRCRDCPYFEDSYLGCRHPDGDGECAEGGGMTLTCKVPYGPNCPLRRRDVEPETEWDGVLSPYIDLFCHLRADVGISVEELSHELIRDSPAELDWFWKQPDFSRRMVLREALSKWNQEEGSGVLYDPCTDGYRLTPETYKTLCRRFGRRVEEIEANREKEREEREETV